MREARTEREPQVALRRRWRTASLACGWRFPDDWEVAELDLVCSAVTRSGGLHGAGAALVALAHARAAVGTGLEETLGDLAALHGVLQVDTGAPAGDTAHTDALDAIAEAADVDALPTRLLRIVAVAWAEVALGDVGATEVYDSLTGLPTETYLRTRLSELYRQAARDGVSVAEGHLLVVISLGFDDGAAYLRPAGMILAADVLRQVFDGGESHAVLGTSTVVALAPRSDDVARRAVRLRRELTERFAVDPQLTEAGSARVNVVRLPASHHDASLLLESLAARQ
ncbi:GGDEF domain-containing protein [Prauserella halophila]|uniref:GGDEF domain-containing protein n=1 Tax=Prauserella halophila TaxID=185641 RepID=UPI003FD6F49D